MGGSNFVLPILKERDGVDNEQVWYFNLMISIFEQRSTFSYTIFIIRHNCKCVPYYYIVNFQKLWDDFLKKTIVNDNGVCVWENCASHCIDNGDWERICGWSSCRECVQCDEVSDKFCYSWCSRSTLSWDHLCTKQNCAACDECLLATSDPTLNPSSAQEPSLDPTFHPTAHQSVDPSSGTLNLQTLKKLYQVPQNYVKVALKLLTPLPEGA